MPGVLGHSPLTVGENESLETAFHISDPTKSWAIYTEIHGSREAHYYELEMQQGERLQLSLFVPISEEAFRPTLVVMGPGIAGLDSVPDFVEVPLGAGRKVLRVYLESEIEYEPFTPMSFYSLLRWSWEISTAGTYYLAVYDASQGGRYGLAVGYRESFDLDEWILVPLSAIEIHQWEGQSFAFIVSPLLITLTLGIGLLAYRKLFLFCNMFCLVGVLAGLLYLGSGFMVLVQMILALSQVVPDRSAILTLVLGLLPIMLGSAILRISTSQESLTNRKRGLLAIFGLLGFFTWSGLLLGPILSIAASLVPTKMSNR
ncbi:MAG: hypothetical protein JSW01_03520 [Candidatus Bathyarchaeota archaeon]|nr:MAG: hypothetical protein JSW01_03520 [Candidatus Bathyarchaeota archaeon]